MAAVAPSRKTRRIVLPALHPLQYALRQEMRRFNVWVCHRRFGKTFLTLELLIERALGNRKERGRYAYIAPLYKQAKTLAWDILTGLTLQIPGTIPHIGELRVTLPGDRQIRLFGADNPDALRGIYLDGVVLDEYAQMRRELWRQVIRPTLADRQGFAIFIGTPHGENHFYDLYQQAQGLAGWHTRILRASQTGIIPDGELAAMQGEMANEDYERELECSWTAAIPGAYFAEEFRAIDAEGRIGALPYDPRFPVQTAWDLGRNDNNVVWFFQVMPDGYTHFIDYLEGNNIALCPDPLNPKTPSWIRAVRAKPYLYDHSQASPPLSRDPYEVHFAPHDIEQHEYSSNKTRHALALAAGLRFTSLPPCQSLPDDIEVARHLLRRSRFDGVKCQEGIRALRNYQRIWDEEKQIFLDAPRHDWASHGASAYRYAAIGLRGASSPRIAPPGNSFTYWRKQAQRAKRGEAVRTFRVGALNG